MLFLLSWVVYGLVVGLIAKAIYRGEAPVGFLATTGIGIAGSYVGGFINWLIGYESGPFATSGIVMGVIGGVISCWLYTRYKSKIYLEIQKANKIDN